MKRSSSRRRSSQAGSEVVPEVTSETTSAPAPRVPVSAWMIPFACFFLSGASGLIFEVIWTRLLTLLFGASTPAISTVLSAYMGGLALGSYVLGRKVDRARHPLALYALAELCVGAFALLVPVVIRYGYPAVSAWITRHGGNSFDVYTLMRFVAVGLVLLPPTVLMGATLPLLTRHFVREGSRIGQRVGALYAVNTLGAVVGTLVAGFVLLPRIGLTWTNTVAALTNVVLAAAVVLLRKHLSAQSWPSSWREWFAHEKTANSSPEPVAPQGSEEPPMLEVATPWTRRVVLATVFGSGLSALAYEVILQRALDMVIGSSVYSFTLILTSFLIGIAGGSALASAALRWRPGPLASAVGGGALLLLGLVAMWLYKTTLTRMTFSIAVLIVLLVTAVSSTSRRPLLALGVMQLLAGIAATTTYVFMDRVPRMFAWLAMMRVDACRPGAVPHFGNHVDSILFISFVTAVVSALPAALCTGATFPLAVRAFAQGTRSVGQDTGTVYSFNTIGSIVGSFVTGFVLLPRVGMETAFYLAVALNLALAIWLLLTAPGEEPARYVLVPATAILLAIATTGTVLGRDGRVSRAGSKWSVFPRPWDRTAMTLGVFRMSVLDELVKPTEQGCVENDSGGRSESELLYYADGVTTTVTVEQVSLTRFALKNNGKVDASNAADMPTQVSVAALPLLLHPRGPEARNVAMIGWGSGVSVGTALRFPIAKLDVIELERATIQASRFFAAYNHLDFNLGDQFPYVSMPRLTIFNNDGRNFLASASTQYDVIVSEPSNPWITGVSNLFTVDHFRAASKALAPDGLYTQWVQLYEMSPENIKTIYRTFAEVFPYVVVFAAEGHSSDTVMIGSRQPIVLDPVRTQAFIDRFPTLATDVMVPARAVSAMDFYARLLFSSRDEVMQFARVEQHLENGAWIDNPQSLGNEPCDPATCRYRAVGLNTDDNARIEFGAPRDLIGFETFAHFTEAFFERNWPYGLAEQSLTLQGDPTQRSAQFGELVISLLRSGQLARARTLVTSQLDGKTREQMMAMPELVRAFELWNALQLHPSEEPPPTMEALVEPADLTESGRKELRMAYTIATQAVRDNKLSLAMEAMSAVPDVTWRGAGPSARMLYLWLLYNQAMASPTLTYLDVVVKELEGLQAEYPAWCATHREVLYYSARAHFWNADFVRGVAEMDRYREALRSSVN